jgi:chemotaxis protein MotA
MANLVWLPIADKLKYIHSQEAVYLEIITDGVMAIQSGEIPSVIKAKLNSKLPEAQQEVD